MFYQSSRLSSLCRPAFGLVLLTCAGLAAAPAHAQTELDLGQAGTKLSGTATITDHGTTASGIYTYNDGGTGTPLDQQNSFGSLLAYGVSTLNLTGGSVGSSEIGPGYVGGYDASIVNVSEGRIVGFLDIHNTSVLNFSRGSVSASLDTLNSSTANITGGSIGDLETYDTSLANISGGTINSFEAYSTRTVTISGGTINTFQASDTSTTNISGGNFTQIETFGTGIVNLFGTSFTQSYLYYDPSYQADTYSITGTLQNGDVLDADYYDYGGKLVFNAPVPEASSVVLLGLLLMLGLGGIAVSRRRKGQAAV